MERMTVYADRVCGRILPEVYGHFIEHLGRGIFTGEIGGFRKTCILKL